MPSPDIRPLSKDETLGALPDLCETLSDCVEGGASLGFMSPFAPADGETFWRGVADAVGRGEVLLYGAFLGDRLIGTVQVGFASKPNQPHRGDLMKLLVHRDARGLGLSKALMAVAEQGAAQAGRTLLVLDTAAGELAEALYEKLGWQRSGIIPNYALFPDGRYCDTVIFWKTVA
ncbi:GNAT family N-acetyltransferase [Agrobacterium sp. MA01]|uniref:GNAT family N-acetyltransferase n=1 Tax=Agrobacterium sp. MA01 TaxID=2664893 RepID=UPI00129A5D6D|nr:GNAT family N-acetyltransferase [Agrobacterium sp. MA01]QGG92878.1 GNAT family N-acetyltransferase [Agrobacterium sp. MA01]